MTDRIPTYPGRVKLVPVTGQTNTYTISMADQPTEEGTPLNKASLLTDETASEVAASDMPTPSTVDNALYYLAEREKDFEALFQTLWSGGLTIIRQPSDVSAPMDSVAKFHVGAIGSGLTYQWQYYATSGTPQWRNNSTSSYNKSTFLITATAARNGYKYRCIVTDSNNNSVTSNAVTLTVD